MIFITTISHLGLDCRLQTSLPTLCPLNFEQNYETVAHISQGKQKELWVASKHFIPGELGIHHGPVQTEDWQLMVHRASYQESNGLDDLTLSKYSAPSSQQNHATKATPNHSILSGPPPASIFHNAKLDEYEL